MVRKEEGRKYTGYYFVTFRLEPNNCLNMTNSKKKKKNSWKSDESWCIFFTKILANMSHQVAKIQFRKKNKLAVCQQFNPHIENRLQQTAEENQFFLLKLCNNTVVG
jgi:hypothetical protein